MSAGTEESGEPTRALRSAREALVLGLFALLTVALTWPWAAHLRDAVSDEGDPYLNAWSLWWDFHQTFHDPLHLFHGNLFWPYRYSLAFSEHNYGVALPLFPLLALGIRPLTAHSVAILLGFALSGYGAFRLARTLTGSPAAALVAGVAFAFTPYRFTQISHVNYLSSAWIPLLLEALVLYVRAPSRKRAVWLFAAFAMNGVTCIHWLVLTLIPLALTFAWLLARVPPGRRLETAKGAAVAVGYAGLVLLPFLLPYQRAAKLYGFVRNRIESAAFSARPSSWFAVDSASRWRRLGLPYGEGELALFPGFLVLLLALVGLVVAWRRRDLRGAVVVGGLWTALGFLGSLGMNAPFHRVLYDTVFLFRSIRVPARWAMPGHLGLALLAAAGALALVSSLRKGRAAALAGIALLVAAEDSMSFLHVMRGAPDPDEATLYLKKTPMRAGIVQLPAGGAHGNYLFDLRAADHGKGLITAVSGFVTPEVRTIQDWTRRDPIPDSLMDLLEKIPASYVTVNDAWLDPYERSLLSAFLARHRGSGRLRFIKRFEKPWRTDVYTVTKTEPESVPEGSVPAELETIPDAGQRGHREDASLTGSIDAPAEDAVVSGELAVRGWARIPGEDLHVTVLIDGVPRPWTSGARTPRPDVAQVLPALAPCATAGYEARYAFRPGDDGPHEVQVLFQTQDGRIRHYPVRHFTWRP